MVLGMYAFALGGVGFVPLHAGDGSVRAWAMVDLQDLPDVARFNWHLTDTGYAARWYGGRPPKRKRDRMHRRILCLSHGDSRQGDHRNRNRLDNRRGNLRVVSGAPQNQQNLTAHHDGSSSFRGVSWDAPRGRWKAQGKPPGGKNTFIGRFATEAEAAEAARLWRLEHLPFSVE